MEKELITAAKQGNTEAFSRLTVLYLKRIYRSAYFFLRNVDDAEDACQSAFINAYRHIKYFDETRPFFPYLYRIIKNVCINQLKKKHNVLLSDPEQLAADSSQAPERILENNYRTEILYRAMDNLNNGFKEILILKYWNNCSYREMADALSVPIGTIMSRIYYARKKLKEKILELEEIK